MDLAYQLRTSGIPVEVINQEIFGKASYNPQQPKLLEDIRNYKETLDFIIELYRDQLNGIIPGTHDWTDTLSNDIWGWANDNEALMYGYVDKMYKIWEKYSQMWTDCMIAANYDLFVDIPRVRRPIKRYKVDCYLTNYLENKTRLQQIRIFWSALLPSERIEFITGRVDVFEHIEPFAIV